MKLIALTLVLIALSPIAHAQLNLNINAGLNKPMIKDGPGANATLKEVAVQPSFFGTANLIGDKPKVVNLGVGLSIKINSIKSRLSYTNSASTVTRVDIKHKSIYASVHPVIDVNVDKKRYFHLLINPAFHFMLWGSENGYSKGYMNEVFTYSHSAKRVKRFVLGFSIQGQVRYPITKQLAATGTLGYSINNSPSGFIPAESGNISGQLGVVLKLWKEQPEEPAATPKDE